jgi:hypothetical protein
MSALCQKQTLAGTRKRRLRRSAIIGYHRGGSSGIWELSKTTLENDRETAHSGMRLVRYHELLLMGTNLCPAAESFWFSSPSVWGHLYHLSRSPRA